MYYTQTATVAFDANHSVDAEHPGCGHRWTLSIEARVYFNPATRMLAPSHDLQLGLHELVDPLRHRSLNEMVLGVSPTPEGLATWASEQLALRFPDITAVTVTASYGASVTLHREIRRVGGVS